LDGSSLAESAIPVACRIAQGADTAITLLHVLEQRPPATVHGERHLADAAGAANYLNTLAARIGVPGMRVTTHVHDNAVADVARSLAEHATEFQASLVVMTAHGRGGLKRWVYGSIAQQVVAANPCPLLVVPCTQGVAHEPMHPRHVIVPLDGDAAHEAALPLARDLAAAYAAPIHLLTVVPTWTQVGGLRAAVARISPVALAAALDLETDAAGEYLRSVRTTWLAPAGTGDNNPDLVERGDPVTMILSMAKRLEPALVVMATHRKVGVASFWSGSVAPRVAARLECPVAMVSIADPVPRAQASPRQSSPVGT